VIAAMIAKRIAGIATALVMLSSLVLPRAAAAQGGAIPPPAELVKIAAEPLTIAAGAEGVAKVRLTIARTWHINANPPFPDYMIPTELALESAGGIRAGEATYPPPHMVKLAFDESELFVYDGIAEVTLPISVAAGAANGTHMVRGKLRFQACNDAVCLPPNSLPVEVSVTVTGGSDAIAPPAPAAGGSGTAAGEPGAERAPPEGGDTEPLAGGGTLDAGGATDGIAPAPARGFTSGPGGQGGGTIDNPIARALEKGSVATFITLFLIGLALNLTPCVYPMLGVTVSIFGGRGATPPLQAFGMAFVYVMGIALMYSVLGLVAAFSGGLFGAALQSPIVLIGIGVLLIALSLSMFGLYELQLPPSLMMKLGGRSTTGVLGVFGSGLLVGVFAAPCIGPPIVALLAIVGAKADPVFGFTSFFILSLGLGLPYLVLGTFSNLLSSLPKSGDWMVWVKKVFGVVLFAIGIFYALLAIAPKLSFWVAPVALLVGGLYLGFFEKSKGRTPVFGWVKRLGGLAAIVAGAFMLVAVMPSKSVAFHEFDEARLQAALQKGQPVLMDFSADWCVPCHELDHFTFTDRRVIDAAEDFVRLKIDLTRYDSPESERLRQAYEITGVPTIVFLTAGGLEVREARVEGFLPPEPFLERIRVAKTAGQAATR
jgi:thiol:disulfide interchange protein DsbD